MTVYMEKPGKRLDSILKWEYFYYDCLVLPRKNKVPKTLSIAGRKCILKKSLLDILHEYKNITY